MAIFNSYVKLPEGISIDGKIWDGLPTPNCSSTHRAAFLAPQQQRHHPGDSLLPRKAAAEPLLGQIFAAEDR